MPSSGVQTCALDRKSTRLNSSHTIISYAVFCLKKTRERRETPVHGVRGRATTAGPGESRPPRQRHRARADHLLVHVLPRIYAGPGFFFKRPGPPESPPLSQRLGGAW